MADYIERQAAIAYSISGMTREIEGDKWIRVSEVRESIKMMPSAQTEITRCHECAKRRTLDCPMGITVFDAPPSDGYCYKAERRKNG